MKRVRITTDDFIKKAKEVHGDKYDYSKVEYINNSTKVCIICPEHGEFWQIPINHLKGFGCAKCTNNHRYTTEEWIKKVINIHGDRYNYSKANYVNRKTKVCIICPEHGEFWQRAGDHMDGQGCPGCTGKNISLKKRANEEDVIRRFKEVHGDKYDYSKVEYVNMYKKVCIICPEHGEFWQMPINHLKERGCYKCHHWGLNTEDWVKLFKTVHKDKYDYSKVEYKNSQTPVCIICPEHGEFWQTPSHHMQGKGCPVCNSSKLELSIKYFLEDNNIKYISQHTFDWLKYENNLKLDFYLPDYNIAIECQGEQHFKPVDFFGGDNGFELTVKRDITKLKLCKEHNINILYFTNENVRIPRSWTHYKVIRNLDKLLKQIYK